MPNSTKRDGAQGAALQVTKQARAADLVEENSNGEATRLAPVCVHAFDALLMLTDREHADDTALEELQLAAIREVGPIRHAADATLSIAGNGYQVALPGAEQAGFELGQTAPAYPAPNVLAIVTGAQQRLAKDLVAIREEQGR